MNRLVSKLKRIKDENRKFLVAYLTGGVPDISGTVEYARALEMGGADIIEIGIPFSDALADGPVNQEAALVAIKGGTGTADMFCIVEKLRSTSDIPIVFLVYYNTIFHYGIRRFMRDCREYGVDGLVIPDLPMEERKEIIDFVNAEDLCLIPLVAPNSGDRAIEITSGVSGFTYCVSSMGVTGVRDKFRDSVENYVRTVKTCSPLPVAVGFGIADAKTAGIFYGFSDGIIVGSAIVKKILNGCDSDELCRFVQSLVYIN
jgi:tryptophan synthase alpha chain